MKEGRAEPAEIPNAAVPRQNPTLSLSERVEEKRQPDLSLLRLFINIRISGLAGPSHLGARCTLHFWGHQRWVHRDEMSSKQIVSAYLV